MKKQRKQRKQRKLSKEQKIKNSAYARKKYAENVEEARERSRKNNAIIRERMKNDIEFASHIRKIRLKAFRKWWKKHKKLQSQRTRTCQLKRLKNIYSE